MLWEGWLQNLTVVTGINNFLDLFDPLLSIPCLTNNNVRPAYIWTHLKFVISQWRKKIMHFMKTSSKFIIWKFWQSLFMVVNGRWLDMMYFPLDCQNNTYVSEILQKYGLDAKQLTAELQSRQILLLTSLHCFPMLGSYLIKFQPLWWSPICKNS